MNYSYLLPFLPPRRLAALAVLLTLLLPSALHAATRNVPAQYAHIQDAINAAQNGDTVLIADGTYTGPGNVDLDFGGRSITVTSQNGPATTIIDCGGTSSANHRGFYLHSGETAIVSGLTIKNGYENYVSGVANSGDGGGICIDVSSVTVQNCIFTNNTVDGEGGGIYNLNNQTNATITLTNCTFAGNTAQYGGGVYNINDPININNGGTITLIGCTVTGNTALQGGGVYNLNNENSGAITLMNCTIIGNMASEGGGGIDNIGSEANNSSTNTITLIGCIITNNTAPNGGGVYSGGGVFSGTTITLTKCRISENTATQSSGGIYSYCSGGTINLNDCILADNAASSGQRRRL